jgi:hypothetical protein
MLGAITRYQVVETNPDGTEVSSRWEREDVALNILEQRARYAFKGRTLFLYKFSNLLKKKGVVTLIGEFEFPVDHFDPFRFYRATIDNDVVHLDRLPRKN